MNIARLPALANRTKSSTHFELHFWYMKDEAMEPRVNPMKTTDPNQPYCELLRDKSVFISTAPAGITPWSKFISRFIDIIMKKRK